MMRLLFGIIAACFGWAAIAQVPMTGAGPSALSGNVLIGGGSFICSYSGPGDVISGAAVWYGLRSYSLSTCNNSQKLVNVRNTSTGETCDILPSLTGSLGNLASCSAASSGNANSYCTTNTCTVTKAYDQSGANNCSSAPCDVSQSTTSSQPTLLINCLNSLPCLQPASGVNNALGSVASSLSGAAFTQSWVGERTSHFTNFNSVIGCGGDTNGANINVQSGLNNLANQGLIFAGTVVGVAGVNDSVLHAVQEIYNGSSSVFNADGSSTSGLNPGAGTCGDRNATIWFASGGNPYFGDIMEAAIWLTAFNGTQDTNMCHNQRLYWGSTGSC